jgi:membrane protein implicated in regulation of membrane protease activity
MAEDTQSVGMAEPVPPVGEEIHLPGGSILPLVVAIGITMTVVGTTIWWVWSVIGFAIFLVATLMWVRDVRQDVDSLPEDHHH